MEITFYLGMIDNKQLNRQHINTEKENLSDDVEVALLVTRPSVILWHLSRDQKEVVEQVMTFARGRVFQEAKPQVQRPWGRTMLGKFAAQLGAQCDWKGVNEAESSRWWKDSEISPGRVCSGSHHLLPTSKSGAIGTSQGRRGTLQVTHRADHHPTPTQHRPHFSQYWPTNAHFRATARLACQNLSSHHLVPQGPSWSTTPSCQIKLQNPFSCSP